jgi:hypothetical protein
LLSFVFVLLFCDGLLLLLLLLLRLPLLRLLLILRSQKGRPEQSLDEIRTLLLLLLMQLMLLVLLLLLFSISLAIHPCVSAAACSPTRPLLYLLRRWPPRLWLHIRRNKRRGRLLHERRRERKHVRGDLRP